MSSAVRSWRTAFLTLRDEAVASPSHSTILRLLDLLIFSQLDSLISAAPVLPSHEVMSDLMLLMELAQNIYHSEGTQDVIRAYIQLSHLFHGVTSSAILKMNLNSCSLVLESFERIVDLLLGEIKTKNALIGNVGVIKATKQCLKCIRHLFGINFTAALPSDNEKLLKFLLQVVGYFQWSSIFSSSISDDQKKPGCIILWETLTVAFVMIGEVYVGVGISVPHGIWVSTLEVLSKVMDIFAGKSVLVEDKIIALFYIEFLHCLHLVLADPRGYIADHVAGFVAALRIFFRYGLVNKSYVSNQPISHQGSVSTSNSSNFLMPSKSSGNGPYRPPHLRRTAENLQHGKDSMVPPKETISITYLASSDSDCSDNDGSGKDNYSSLFAKARLGAIICIQDLCRADPKMFIAQWSMLLPSTDVLQHRKQETTLMSVLLFDPHLKVRITAGSTIMSMLDGPASVSLKIAEYKGSSKCGSFTTLSSSLGHILMELHSGTLHLIKHETHSRLLELSFKILMLLISSTPYLRMSEELLWTIISSVQSRIVTFPLQSDRNSLPEAAICCLTITLSVSPSSTHVNNILQSEISTGIIEGKHKSGVLHTLFHYSSQSSNPSISLEAFQALKALAHNYPEVAVLCWEKISSIVYGFLSPSLKGSSKSWKASLERPITSIMERVMTASIKVLDECLRAVSGFKGTEDITDDKFLDNPFTSDYIKTKAISSVPLFDLGSPASIQDECSSTLLASERWFEVTVKHMPLIIKHPSAMVRAASVTCFAGITSFIFFSLSEDKQEFIISSLIDAAMSDDVPSVRSAACRAIGAISCFPQLYNRTKISEKFIHAAQKNACDPLVSVRITASWALANICYSLSHHLNIHYSGRETRESSRYILMLVDIALQLTKDNDKVKANAVRALGNLSRFFPFSNQSHMHGEPTEYNEEEPSNNNLKDWSNSLASTASRNCEWLEKMVQAFLSCVTTGNVKVQWNVCYALSNLFFNKSLKLEDKDWASSVFSILLLLLRDSSNFKIRIQAAAALAVPDTVNDYGRSYSDVIKGVEHIVENFDSNQISAPSNFKYWIALEKQLTSTLLHLLGLAARSEQQALQEFLTKKAMFLEVWIKNLCSSLEGTGKSGDQVKNIALMDQKKDVIARTIQSLIQMYERHNHHSLAQRFHRLADTLL